MKVFCIGFNKTGTTSLHEHFVLAGLDSSHDATYQRNTRTMPDDDLRTYLDAHDAFSDGERADYRRLESMYPDARFVLNTRGLKAWLESRVKHVYRQGGAALEGPWAGPMAQEYLRDPERAISDWIDRREFYHRSVIEHFVRDRSHALLRINVTEDPRWQADLDAFLGTRAATQQTGRIHANPASADVESPEIREHLARVETVLVQKDIPPEEWTSDTYVGFRPIRAPRT